MPCSQLPKSPNCKIAKCFFVKHYKHSDFSYYYILYYNIIYNNILIRHFSCSFVLLFLRFCNFAIWGLGDLTCKSIILSIILVLVLELAGEPEGDDCLAAVLGIHLEIAAYGVEDGLADGDAEG